MENENCFELAGGSSYRGFELPRVDWSLRHKPRKYIFRLDFGDKYVAYLVVKYIDEQYKQN